MTVIIVFLSEAADWLCVCELLLVEIAQSVPNYLQYKYLPVKFLFWANLSRDMSTENKN